MYLKGLIESFRQNWNAAIDCFEYCCAEAEWYGHGRDALSSQNNLFVALVVSRASDGNDRSRMIRLFQLLCATVAKLYKMIDSIDTKHVFEEHLHTYERILEHGHDYSAHSREEYIALFPDSTEKGNGRFAVCLWNLSQVYILFPDIFNMGEYAWLKSIFPAHPPLNAMSCLNAHDFKLLMIA